MLDFALANYIFAMFLIVFVFFIFFRMFASTKFAGLFTVLFVGLFLSYIFSHDVELLQKLTFLTSMTSAVFGFCCCIFSSIGLFIGFSHEDKSEESVHSKFYWSAMVGLSYFGSYCIAVAVNSL